TAVNVVAMVFGNMGDDSGTGVAFTRNPNTGERVLFGEYLTNAQGEDVVAGIRTPSPISQLAQDMPGVYDEFNRIGQQLE
ncbi:MAG TPA: PEP/pyruvate-binding domain-containing protein, partial [Candidatus Limnocylindrales bacterium]|nr:PEP/pyruvate-binding domain-containing protein [Candidatus Limnocylindrales bacterium]